MTDAKKPEKKLKLKLQKETLKKLTVDKVEQAGGAFVRAGVGSKGSLQAECCAYGGTALASVD